MLEPPQKRFSHESTIYFLNKNNKNNKMFQLIFFYFLKQKKYMVEFLNNCALEWSKFFMKQDSDKDERKFQYIV